VSFADLRPSSGARAPSGPLVACLARIEAFAGLPESELRAIARFTRERRAAPRERLFGRGEACACVFALLEGSAKLVRRSDGAETVMALLAPGSLLGGSALFSGSGHDCDAITLAESRLLCLTALPFLRHLQHSPHTAQCLLAHMARRLDGLLTRVERQARFSAEQTVAAFLLDHCNDKGELSGAAACERRDLSALLDLRPETLSRALSRFRREGWLHEHSDGRTVVDRGALAARLPPGA
jgi:CRP/FNR family transcriptional regulator